MTEPRFAYTAQELRTAREEIQKYRMKDPDQPQNGYKISDRTATLIGQSSLQDDKLLLRLYHILGRLIGEVEEEER